MSGEDDLFEDERAGVKWPNDPAIEAKLKRYREALEAIRAFLKPGAELKMGRLVVGAYKMACDALQELE